MQTKKNLKEYGGAALEYVIVSVFALGLTVAGIALVGTTIKHKLKDLSQSFDEELELEILKQFPE
jgi:Flp pilus assembly pilin Flp